MDAEANSKSNQLGQQNPKKIPKTQRFLPITIYNISQTQNGLFPVTVQFFKNEF